MRGIFGISNWACCRSGKCSSCNCGGSDQYIVANNRRSGSCDVYPMCGEKWHISACCGYETDGRDDSDYYSDRWVLVVRILALNNGVLVGSAVK